MRSYEAAKRAATGEPVPFAIGYQVVNDSGALVRKEEIFTASGDVSPIMLSEFSRNAQMESTDPEAMALLAQFFVEAFGDEAEYRRFLRFRSEHKLPDDQIMEIISGLIEDLSGRPTVQPSPSRSGQSTSGPTSRDDSPPPAIAAPVRFTVIEDVDALASSG